MENEHKECEGKDGGFVDSAVFTGRYLQTSKHCVSHQVDIIILLSLCPVVSCQLSN